MLSKIPSDAQNNPFAMYMSQRSCIRGFKFVFGIDIEEVAIRFYNLFVDQEAVPRVYEIDVVQFFNTALTIANQDKISFKELGFKYYDYDSNGQIGSVDIVNFIKYLPYDKIKKIEQKYNDIYDQKVLVANAKKTGTFKDIRHTINMIPFDAEISDVEDRTSKQNSALNHDLETDSEEGDSKNDVLDLRKIRKMNQYKQKEMDFMKSKKINGLWNLVLFEVKQLRNYYVDNSVIPMIKSSNQQPMTKKVFATKFVPLIIDKFQSTDASEALKLPAIIYFFRAQMVALEQDLLWNKEKKEIKVDRQDSKEMLIYKQEQQQLLLEKNMTEPMLVNKYLAKIDPDPNLFSEEIKAMMVSLVALSNLPLAVQQQFAHV